MIIHYIEELSEFTTEQFNYLKNRIMSNEKIRAMMAKVSIRFQVTEFSADESTAKVDLFAIPDGKFDTEIEAEKFALEYTKKHVQPVTVVKIYE